MLRPVALLGDKKWGKRFPKVRDAPLGSKRGRKCYRRDQAQAFGHFGKFSGRRSFLAVLDGVTDGAEVLAAGLYEFLGALHEGADVIQTGGRIFYFGSDLVQFGDRLGVIEFIL